MSFESSNLIQEINAVEIQAPRHRSLSGQGMEGRIAYSDPKRAL